MQLHFIYLQLPGERVNASSYTSLTFVAPLLYKYWIATFSYLKVVFNSIPLSNKYIILMPSITLVTKNQANSNQIFLTH